VFIFVTQIEYRTNHHVIHVGNFKSNDESSCLFDLMKFHKILSVEDKADVGDKVGVG
jgi:hypothetical protein